MHKQDTLLLFLDHLHADTVPAADIITTFFVYCCVYFAFFENILPSQFNDDDLSDVSVLSLFVSDANSELKLMHNSREPTDQEMPDIENTDLISTDQEIPDIENTDLIPSETDSSELKWMAKKVLGQSPQPELF